MAINRHSKIGKAIAVISLFFAVSFCLSSTASERAQNQKSLVPVAYAAESTDNTNLFLSLVENLVEFFKQIRETLLGIISSGSSSGGIGGLLNTNLNINLNLNLNILNKNLNFNPNINGIIENFNTNGSFPWDNKNKNSGLSNLNDNQLPNPFGNSNANSGSGSSSGGSSSGGSGGGGENGTSKNPYKLEPNQFKKLCGQNTYVLSWRIAGISMRDMAAPLGGGNTAQETVWQIPTCEELAKCHCCCNTCKTPPSECKQDGWVFNEKDKCPQKCKEKCEDECEKECNNWKKPIPPDKAPLDRDCNCQQEGCPDGKGCKIIIKDLGMTGVDFTTKVTPPEQFNKAKGVAMFPNGNGPVEEGSKIKSENSDIKGAGWVVTLTPMPGQCCKCVKDAKSESGGDGGGSGSGGGC